MKATKTKNTCSQKYVKEVKNEDTQLQECPLEKSLNVGNFVQLAFAANKSQEPPMVHSANSPKRV